MAAVRRQRDAARSRHPKVLRRIEEIKRRAEVLTKVPEYVETEYTRDVYRLLKCSRLTPAELANWIKDVFPRAKCKAGTNPCTVVVRGTSDFETKQASKIGAKLSKALANGLSASEFESSLDLPDRTPEPKPAGMHARRDHRPGTEI
jgi:hypothetical protein